MAYNGGRRGRVDAHIPIVSFFRRCWPFRSDSLVGNTTCSSANAWPWPWPRPPSCAVRHAARMPRAALPCAAVTADGGALQARTRVARRTARAREARCGACAQCVCVHCHFVCVCVRRCVCACECACVRTRVCVRLHAVVCCLLHVACSMLSGCMYHAMLPRGRMLPVACPQLRVLSPFIRSHSLWSPSADRCSSIR